jgi:hypothetical protein
VKSPRSGCDYPQATSAGSVPFTFLRRRLHLDEVTPSRTHDVTLRLRDIGRHRVAVVRGRCNEELLLGRHGKGTKVTGTIHRILERPRKRNQLEIRPRGVLLRRRCNLRRVHIRKPQELATQDLCLLVAHGILESHVANSETSTRRESSVRCTRQSSTVTSSAVRLRRR